MTDLNALADRVEEARGGDRELDVLVWCAKVGIEPEWQGNILVAGAEGVLGWIDPGKHQRNFGTSRATTGPSAIPAYLTSLDAAKTIVPEGANFSVDRIGSRGGAVVNLTPIAGRAHIGNAATPAAALTAACLRARATGGSHG